MKFIITLFISSILSYTHCTAQENNNATIKISGTVFSIVDKAKLSHVNIHVLKTTVGATTNLKGEFLMYVPKKYSNDSLQISALGFKPLTFKVSDVSKTHQFLLEEASVNLEEVIVTNFTAKSIVEKAIANIAANYQGEPYKNTGFYRLLTKKGEEYVQLSESVFEIYHANNSSNANQFKLINNRDLTDYNALHNLSIGINAKSIFQLDIINNAKEINLLTKKGMKRHNFKFSAPKIYNNREVFSVQFDKKDNVKKTGFKGELLIDKETFAFVYFKLSRKDISLNDVTNVLERGLMKLMGIKIGINSFIYEIKYNKIGDKYYFSGGRYNSEFAIKRSKGRYDFVINLDFDYRVTDIIKNASAFDKDVIFKKNKIIEREYFKYDPVFWLNYDELYPNTSFEVIKEEIRTNQELDNYIKPWKAVDNR